MNIYGFNTLAPSLLSYPVYLHHLTPSPSSLLSSEHAANATSKLNTLRLYDANLRLPEPQIRLRYHHRKRATPRLPPIDIT